MLLSTDRPDMTWSLVGTGAAFLTDEDALTNGRPSSGTRIQWLSGAQTTASVLKLRGTWSSGLVPVRLVGLIGLNLTVGLKIIAALRHDLSWNYRPVEGVVVERQDGVRVAWFVFDQTGDDQDEVDGIEFQIFNDAGGYAVIDADSTFDIGEAWGAPASEWCIRPSYESGRDDLSKMRKSIGGQPFPVRRRSETISQVEFTPLVYQSAFGDQPTYGSPSLSIVRESLLAYQPSVIVPMTAEPFTGGGVDAAYVNKFAEFGYANSIGPIKGEAPRFVMSAGFVAPPALLP